MSSPLDHFINPDQARQGDTGRGTGRHHGYPKLTITWHRKVGWTSKRGGSERPPDVGRRGLSSVARSPNSRIDRRMRLLRLLVEIAAILPSLGAAVAAAGTDGTSYFKCLPELRVGHIRVTVYIDC